MGQRRDVREVRTQDVGHAAERRTIRLFPRVGKGHVAVTTWASDDAVTMLVADADGPTAAVTIDRTEWEAIVEAMATS